MRGWDLAAAGCPVSGVPHSRQNLVAGRLAKPHCGHRVGMETPHSPQNFVPSGFPVPQLGQRMVLLYPDVSAGARQNVWLSSEAACSSGSGQSNTRARNSSGKERFSPLPNSGLVSFVSKNIRRVRAQHLFSHTPVSQATYNCIAPRAFREN